MRCHWARSHCWDNLRHAAAGFFVISVLRDVLRIRAPFVVKWGGPSRCVGWEWQRAVPVKQSQQTTKGQKDSHANPHVWKCQRPVWARVWSGRRVPLAVSQKLKFWVTGVGWHAAMVKWREGVLCDEGRSVVPSLDFGRRASGRGGLHCGHAAALEGEDCCGCRGWGEAAAQRLMLET